jgi:serine/threonine protein kinase
MPLARKDFELNSEERAHEKERDVISEIVRNAKQHKNIMKSLGSLEIGLTYSLFMPLADCDLKQYMERYPSPPSSSKQKAEIMDCAVGLAGAIVYLQDELETPFYEKLSCFHMDLKPQNILVVKDPKTGKYQWKLSDFNMSRVKMKRIETIDQTTLRRSMTASEKVYDINKLFRRRIPVATESSVDYTINRRGAGTYLAPEACIENHPVHAESDTWSLGCVLSVVLSYLYGGQEAVQAYSNMRGKDGSDRFFYAKGGGEKLHKLSDARVNNAVKKWHQHLRDMTKKESPTESAIFAKLIEFLDHKVLVIDPKRRKDTSANEIRNKLIVAFKEFGNIVDPPFVHRPAPASQTSWMGKIFKEALPEVELRHWDIPMSTTVRTCAFGPSAQPLVIVTDSLLTACSPKHLLLSKDASLSQYDLINYGKASPEDKSRRWTANVGVSAQYILAATDHHEFDVSSAQSAFESCLLVEVLLLSHI